ncbi:sortase [Micromonospora sp. NPDC092111]|uniref:sortase n=1 Tax=Micromonospora sp. NPDC092111 TaxID=3364289 RepID=UPI0037F612FE
MTTTGTPPAATAARTRPGPARTHPGPAPHGPAQLAAGALGLLALLLLGFVAHLTVLSRVQYERDQQIAYADLRGELANATAPTGQVDQEGRLLASGTPVAVLEIKAIGLRQVVLEGTSAGVLTAGPGHRRDSVLPGQAGTSVLLGRRAAYGGPFGRLDLLSTDDVITVTTGQGRHTYRVQAVRRTGDQVPPPLGPGAGRLTLITADGQPFLPADLLRVDAELVSPAQPVGPRPLTAAALPRADQPMATDPAAWTPLLLWSQALLAAVLGFAWLRARWGRWQSWVVGVPVLAALGITVADQVSRLLPNLL